MLIGWLHHILDFMNTPETWNDLYFQCILTAPTNKSTTPPVADRSNQVRTQCSWNSPNCPFCMWWEKKMWGMGSWWVFEAGDLSRGGLCGKFFIVPVANFWETWLQTLSAHTGYDGGMEKHHTSPSVRIKMWHTHTRSLHTPVLCLSPVLSTLCSFQSNHRLDETEESTDTMGAALIKSIISRHASRVCW